MEKDVIEGNKEKDFIDMSIKKIGQQINEMQKKQQLEDTVSVRVNKAITKVMALKWSSLLVILALISIHLLIILNRIDKIEDRMSKKIGRDPGSDSKIKASVIKGL